jgi:hypothetical protein
MFRYMLPEIQIVWKANVFPGPAGQVLDDASAFTVTVTVFGTAKPCNQQGSQRLMGFTHRELQRSCGNNGTTKNDTDATFSWKPQTHCKNHPTSCSTAYQNTKV